MSTENPLYPGFGFIGNFRNGQVYGNFWVGMVHGGYLHGKADKNGLITGNDITFIYPDGETAYKVNRFRIWKFLKFCHGNTLIDWTK